MNKLIAIIIGFYPLLRTISDKGSGHVWNLLGLILFLKLFFNISNYKKIFLCVFLFSMTYLHNQMNFFLTVGEIKAENLKFFLTILMLLLAYDRKMIENIKNFFCRYGLIITVSNIISLLIQYIEIFINKKMIIHDGVLQILGTTTTSHMLGYLLYAIIVSSVYLSLINNRWYFRIPLFLAGGLIILLDARTIMGACFMIMAILLIKFKDIKNINKLIVIFIGVIGSIILLNSELPIFQKNEYSQQTSSMLSGRDIFWKSDIDYYKQQSEITKLFGNGLGITHYVNYTTYHMRIWAHNDLIEILVNRGLIVLIIYIVLFLRYFYFLWIQGGYWISCCIIGSTLVIMLMNGFYTYIIPTMYIPLLILINQDKSLRGEVGTT